MEQKVLQVNRMNRALKLQENRLQENQPEHQKTPDETPHPAAQRLSEDALRCRALEDEIKRLHVSLEVNQKNTAHLIKQNQEVLKKKIRIMREDEHRMKEEIERYRHALRDRNNELCNLELEIENMRATQEKSGTITVNQPHPEQQPQQPAKISRRAEKQLAALQQQIDQLLEENKQLNTAAEESNKNQDQLQNIILDQNAELERQQQEINLKDDDLEQLKKQLDEEKQKLQQVESTLFASRKEDGAHQIITNAIAQKWPEAQEALKEFQTDLPSALQQLIDLVAFQNDLENETALSPAPYNLQNLLTELETNYTEKAETKKIYFALSSSRLPTPLYTAPGKVETILKQLIDYAFQHTEKGRMGVHTSCGAEADHLTVSTQIAYTAADPEDPSLAQTFAGDDAENDHTQDDTSLALLRLYARHLGGDITVEFRPNGLTTINFTFSAHAEAAA